MRSVRRWTQGALAVLAGGLLAGATPALALEPGVHIDPGSPAAKEYAIPLSKAREGGGGGGSSGTEAALFGAGITPPTSGSGHGGGTHGSGSRGGSSPHGSSGTGAGGPAASGGGAGTGGAGGAGSGPGSPPASVLHDAGDSSAGGSSVLVLIGGGVAVLVLAGFGGTVLRHHRRPRPTP
jgi:hypothetical protein